MTLQVFGKQVSIKTEIIIAGAIILVLLAGLTGYLIVINDKDIIIDTQSEAASAEQTAAPAAPTGTAVQTAETGQNDIADEIKVYVVGCVNNQGIVTLKKGQLIDDAIRSAGGATGDADLNNINLVYELKGNVMLDIRPKQTPQQPFGKAGGSGESGNTGVAGKGVKIVTDSGGAVINDNESGAGPAGKVDINTASVGELDTLPGIGEATAKDIISFREKNGPFKGIQDIMKVPRIKESRFNSIKDFITVD